MGRKQHPCWEQVTILHHTTKTIKRVQCNHCGLTFSGGGTRIKEHFFGSKNIRPCPKFVKDNKERVYPGASLINLDSPGDKLGDSYRFKEEQMTSHEEVVDMNRELNQHEKKRVGPFSVFTTVDARDSQLIEYVFDPSLAENQQYDDEIIISFPCLYLTRKDFSTLKPRGLLDSEVIDAFAEYLTHTERRKKSIPSNWYLPIMFSYCALKADARSFLEFVARHRMRENYMLNFVNCEKMFIPVRVNKGEGHYYLYVVHLKEKRVEIWDSLPSMKEDYRETAQRLLCALDNLFVEDLEDSGLAFKNFTWTMVDNTPKQPDSYDCGIFVIKFMQQSFNEKRSPSFQFDSEDERLRLALDLLKSDLNNQRKTLHLKAANRNYAQSKEEDLPTPKFNKRKRIDTSIYSEEVQREEYTTSDNSRRRIKQDVSFCGLQEKSNCFNDFKKGHTKGYTLPTTDLIGDQFQNYTKQIWEWLMKYEVSVIGVWGMGGVGKTELVKHVQNQLLERNDYGSFDYVIWVTVTRDCKISHLRKVIAQSIELDISDEPEEKRIIGKLFEKFRDIKCLLILDDIWNPIDLKDIGIPISNNRSKLILTTRSLDVCQSVNCEKIIKINTLEEKATWELFRKTLGENVTLSSEVESIAQSVVKKCEGLPLAIVTVARSMKYKKQVWEWEHMLESLRNLGNGQSDLEELVFPVLRSSYDHLKSKKLQECFLYCALDSTINVTESFVMEGLIDGMLGLEAQKNECQSILHKLINNSLLLEQRESLLSEKVHYLIQGMAASIVKETHMVAIDRKFIAIPEMNEKLEKVFLKCQPIREIPDGTSWRCPKLSTFLLRWSNLNRIADDFFINMTSLKILNLSETDITRLPESVSNLECLVALWLYGCKSLRYVPSLAKLRKLMWLSLHSTGITEVPQGLEMLVNLRWLDLRRTPASFTTASVIPKLTNLQSLHLNCIPGSMDVKAEDILGLEMLENISAHFCDPLNFEDYVTRFPSTSPRLFSYKLSLGTSRTPSYNEYSIGQKVLEFVGVNKECSRPVLPLPKELQKLIINQCHQWAICLCDVLYCRSYKLSRIKSCCISDCSKLEYLFCMSSYCIFCDSVQLDSLELKGLAGLRVLCNYNKLAPPMYLFYHLKDLSIEECHSIKKLLTPQLSAQLQNLESLTVRYCKSMKEIFSARGGEEEDEYEEASAVTLPALKSISLMGLPELNFLFRGTIVCPLSRLNISDCEKLICPPAFLPPVPIWKILDGWST